MRLLYRKNGELTFTTDQQSTEPYAILSHTWGQGEVTFEDVCSGRLDKPGYHKLEFTLQQAARDGYRYVWIDTCCIDKRDRVELGEAINCMWSWYAQAAVCYVYLSDVSDVAHFSSSRWFTRGWTLQELIAPKDVRFYAADARYLGNRLDLSRAILKITNIDHSKPLSETSFSERFKWSLTRQTTKPEDSSYCLLGLLEVKLIFNYGEDGGTARERLLEAVAKEHGRKVVRDIQRELAHAPTNQYVITGGRTRESLLKQLEFDAQARRWQTISKPYASTCTWILDHEDYKRWMSGDMHILWLKGKAGSGKSTLMKFIQSQTNRTCISFYFNARGELLERSTLGLYRSLLAQLLRRYDISAQVLQHINEQQKDGADWTVESPHDLRSAIRFATTLLQEPVQCYVDALDECDLQQVKELVELFEDVTGKYVYVCFASRHYPAITIRRSVEIALEKQQHSDIAVFVHGRLVITEDPIDLARQIIDKANGLFVWAVLVVQLLNDDLVNGNIYQVEQRLHSLPSELLDLLQSIAKCNSREDVERFRLCLYWLLYGRRPLTPSQFYLVVVTGLAEAGFAPVIAYSNPWQNMPDSQLERFVSSCSHGLAEVTAAGTVQLMHQCVRDFLLEHQGLLDLHSSTDEDLDCLGNDWLKRICVRYMSGHAYDEVAGGTDSELQSLTDSYPLLLYASIETGFHAEFAARSIPQDDFVRTFDFVSAQMIATRLIGLPGLSLAAVPSTKSSIEWQWSVITCLASSNSPRLVRTAHALGLFYDHCGLSPFEVALMNSSMLAYDALLDCDKDFTVKNRGMVYRLRTLPTDAYVPLLEHSMQHKLALDIPDVEGETCLMQAIKRGSYESTLLLLDYGVDVTAKTKSGWTALHYAVVQRRIELVTALLDHSARIDDVTDAGETALGIGIAEKAYDLVLVLLGRSADANAQHLEVSPLLAACRLGDHVLIDWLLDYGANVEAKDEAGSTILLAVCKQLLTRHVLAVIVKLLYHGADAQAVCDEGLTALMSICSRKYDTDHGYSGLPGLNLTVRFDNANPFAPMEHFRSDVYMGASKDDSTGIGHDRLSEKAQEGSLDRQYLSLREDVSSSSGLDSSFDRTSFSSSLNSAQAYRPAKPNGKRSRSQDSDTDSDWVTATESIRPNPKSCHSFSVEHDDLSDIAERLGRDFSLYTQRLGIIQEAIGTLLAAGCDPAAKSKDGKTALDMAVAADNRAAARALLMWSLADQQLADDAYRQLRSSNSTKAYKERSRK